MNKCFIISMMNIDTFKRSGVIPSLSDNSYVWIFCLPSSNSGLGKKYIWRNNYVLVERYKYLLLEGTWSKDRCFDYSAAISLRLVDPSPVTTQLLTHPLSPESIQRNCKLFKSFQGVSWNINYINRCSLSRNVHYQWTLRN